MSNVFNLVLERREGRRNEWPVRPGFLLIALLLPVLPGCATREESALSCCENDLAASVAVEDARGGNLETDKRPEALQSDEILASHWLPPHERSKLQLDHQLTRHDGRPVRLNELVGQPLAISFAYTRCMNPNKCRAVTTAMGGLQRKIKQASLAEQVNLVLITYDPLYDTPKVMREYAKRNQLELNEHALFLRPPPDPEHRLFHDLGVNASFHRTGVSIHSIQLLLVDKSGRLARTYRTLIWDNEEVAKDLARLAAE